MSDQHLNTRREVLLERIERDPKRLRLLRANAANPAEDVGGGATATVRSTVRNHGVRVYVVLQDKHAFRENLCESARIAISLFERAAKGHPIDRSFLTLLAYKDLFDALAIHDMALARTLAEAMLSREMQERENVHPFDIALGYCLVAFVLEDSDQMPKRLDVFRQECKRRRSTDFRGYVTVFEAILERNNAKASKGFVELLKGHQRQCKGNGVFRFTADQDLCVWGLGLANLARHYGLDIRISDPLIPSELIA